jgi:hypothetical protein
VRVDQTEKCESGFRANLIEQKVRHAVKWPRRAIISPRVGSREAEHYHTDQPHGCPRRPWLNKLGGGESPGASPRESGNRFRGKGDAQANKQSLVDGRPARGLVLRDSVVKVPPRR